MAEALIALSSVPALGDYLGGRFVSAEHHADGVIERLSPRDEGDLVARHFTRERAIDEALTHARAAFPAWSRRPLDERRSLVLKLREALSRRADELALTIVREVGKPLWEAKGEVSAALNKIDVTLTDGLGLVEPRQVAAGQRYAFRPHGVGVVLGPFNFPLHLVHGHVVPALVTGNTVIVKPSELAPTVGQLYAQCFHDAGFPDGVFNLVQGGPSFGAALAAHPAVDLVMLTGSYAAGQAVKRATLDQPHKLLALELGGRNPAVVLSDANLEKAVHDVLWGAFVTTGQRCSGTATALVERSVGDAFSALLLDKLRGIRVGDPLAPDVFMGPLVSDGARARFLDSLAAAERAGVVRLGASTAVSGAPKGAYVCASVHRITAPNDLPYETEELFGPDLAIEIVDDLEHAIARANASPYGLSVSLFSGSSECFEYAAPRLRFGCVNWNAPTCGASARLPFGGTRKSGNHRPAALFATYYTTYPVATLEGGGDLDRTALSPGFAW